MSGEKGIAFVAPPPHLLADAQKVIDGIAKQLPKGTNGAVIGVATENGWNAAIVHRAGDRFQVAGWLGKDWSAPVTGGAAVRMTW